MGDAMPVEVESSELALQRAATREQILRLQQAMVPLQTALPDPSHHFAPGMYCRTLMVPAGMLIIGKTHRHEHLVMILSGRATSVSEFGVEELQAPYVGVSRAGLKRAVYAHEDTLFVTVHTNPDDTRDLEVLEARHIIPEAAPLPAEMAEMLE
jgi:hypothetical protein